MPAAEKIFIKVRTSDLCNLFNCSKETIRRWRVQGKLNPHSLEDVIEKYNDPSGLDKRRTRKVLPAEKIFEK